MTQALHHKSQLAGKILVLAQPGIHVFTVTLEPLDLGTDSIETLLDGTVEAL